MTDDATRRSLLIATTPRSGSWLLSDYLSATGVVGVPREYFHINYVATVSKEFGLETTGITEAYISEVVRREATDEGVFSAKLHWLQINQLVTALRGFDSQFAGLPTPELIASWLPSPAYVYLTRRDKARQAISMFRAMRTEQWWEPAPSDGEDTASPVDVIPDYLSIRWFEDHLHSEEAEWLRYFDTFGLDPIIVCYEDFVLDPPGMMRSLLDALGMEHVEVPAAPGRTKRQSDTSTEQALEEYLVVRDFLPRIPRGWAWSFARRAFGAIDASSTQVGVVADVGDLTPL